MFAVNGKGKGGFKGTCFKCGVRGHKADRCWQKGKGEGGKGDWEKGKRWIQRKGMVTRGTILGTLPVGTAKRMVLKWIRGRLLNLFLISVQSVRNHVARSFLNRKNVVRGTHTKTSQSGSQGDSAHVNRFSILASDDGESPGEWCASKHVSITEML